jgi:hypothetical protein
MVMTLRRSGLGAADFVTEADGLTPRRAAPSDEDWLDSCGSVAVWWK